MSVFSLSPSAKIVLIFINVLLWLAFFFFAVLFFVLALFIRVVTGPFDSNLKILHWYSCLWASVYLWINPFWVLKKRGIETVDRDRTYVIVSNHQSMADTLVLFNTFLHFKWVAKKTVFNIPFIGWNMRLNGYVSIEAAERDYGVVVRYQGSSERLVCLPEHHALDGVATEERRRYEDPKGLSDL